MDAIIAMKGRQRPIRRKGSYRAMARHAAITIGAIFLGLTLASTLSGYVINAPEEADLPIASAPATELPFDWQPRKAVTFDHMYMDDRPTRKLDWIRNQGSLSQ